MAEEGKKSSSLWETVKTVFWALVIAGIFRTIFFQPFWIPSGSMKDTLLIGDFLFVNKMAYGYSYASCPSIRIQRFGINIDAKDICGFLDGDNTRLFGGEPERGDIIVFRHPVQGTDFIKRVIGLPGDEVVMVDGIVSVNGVELDETYAMLDSDDGEWTVPEGQLFVLGDNRSNSADSRSTLGFIDVDDVVGRAVIRIWPVDRFGSIEGDGADFDDASGGGVPAALSLAPVVGFVVRKRAA